jgi:pimeloyl-ACP methyl ester carboxylesterase
MSMGNSKTFAMVTVPAMAGMAWLRYRTSVRLLEAQPASAPILPGHRRQIRTSWGSVAYRWVDGDPSRPALVLVHGWGKTADSAWWPVIAGCRRTMVVLDLPGHGESRLDAPFTFELAADAVQEVVRHAGLTRPVLAGHSMGGPVAFTTVRRSGAQAFSGLVALATSAYWVRPRLQAMMAMAPYAMAPHSPVLIHRRRTELRHTPELAEHLAWSYQDRPARRLLGETATALRHFDARHWNDLELPPATWVVAANDGVLAPEHQLASARHFAADVVVVDAQHSMVIESPNEVVEILERAGADDAGRRHDSGAPEPR